MGLNDVRQAEKNKLIARLLSEGQDIGQIKSALVSAGFREKPKPTVVSEGISKVKGAIGDAASAVGNKAMGVMEAGAEAHAKDGWKSPAGAAFGGGKAALDAIDKVMGPLTGLIDAPVIEMNAEKSLLKKPAAALRGIYNNITKPSSEQVTPSEKQGKTGLDAFVTDMLVPSTLVSGGLVKNFLKMPAKAAAKAGAKNLAKGTLLGGAVAQMASQGDASNALPLAAMAATVNPKKWAEIPEGMHSVLEKEILTLGKKPMSSLHIGKQLKGRTNIKPDEWRDTGMDKILASKQEWTPEGLQMAVRLNRPKLKLDDTSKKYKAYSTAKDDSESLETPYKELQLKQRDVDFEQPHWAGNTVAHNRTDQAAVMPDASEEEKLLRAKYYDLDETKHAMLQYGDTQYNEEIRNISKELQDIDSKLKVFNASRQPSRHDFVMIEDQSDLHQKANKKVNKQPPKYVGDEAALAQMDEMYGGEPLAVTNPEWERWNKLSPEEKQRKIGYRTPEEDVKRFKMQEMLDNSVFNTHNFLSSSKQRNDYAMVKEAKLHRALERFKKPDAKMSVPNMRGFPEQAESLKTRFDPKEDFTRWAKLSALMDAKSAVRGVVADHKIPRKANPLHQGLSSRQAQDFDKYKKYDRELKTGYDNAHIGANRRQRTADEAWENRNDPALQDPNDWYHGSAGENPYSKLATKQREIEAKPPDNAIMKKTWPMFMMKRALIDAVNSGSDRFGIIDGKDIARHLQDPKNKGIHNWYDSELPGQLESFLKSQGVDAKFGPTEPFKADKARFMDLTPELKALVKAGLPMYVAIAMMEDRNRQ